MVAPKDKKKSPARPSKRRKINLNPLPKALQVPALTRIGLDTAGKKVLFLEFFRVLPIQTLGAKFVGVDDDTITNWKKSDPLFSEMVSTILSEWYLGKVNSVDSSEWLLARIGKDHFAERTEHTGKDGQPLVDPKAAREEVHDIITEQLERFNVPNQPRPDSIPPDPGDVQRDPDGEPTAGTFVNPTEAAELAALQPPVSEPHPEADPGVS